MASGTDKKIKLFNSVSVKKLIKPIVFNGKMITHIHVELDHINSGLSKDDTGKSKLKDSKRTNFSLNDIEKFIRMLDGEELAPARYEGRNCIFNVKIDCPISGPFRERRFLMVFKTFHSPTDLIHTITIFPIKQRSL